MSILVWGGIEITLSYTQPAYSSPFHHIELRAPQRLPVTETGYRSHFLHPQELALWETPEAFVTDWLNHWANEPSWQAYVQQSRQLSLF
jgi:hypothetical protein